MSAQEDLARYLGQRSERMQQDALARLEAVNNELAAASRIFQQRQGQIVGAMGDPTVLYQAHLATLHNFCKRFAEFVPTAADLAGHGFTALRDRLSFLLTDTESAIAILQQMCATRAAGNAAIAGIQQAAAADIMTSMRNINEGWRKAFGVDRKR